MNIQNTNNNEVMTELEAVADLPEVKTTKLLLTIKRSKSMVYRTPVKGSSPDLRVEKTRVMVFRSLTRLHGTNVCG